MTLAVVLGAAGRTCLRADSPYTLAAGTKLYVRLEVGVSTKTSHLNQVVTARVVRDATTHQGVMVPIGSEVTGKIVRVIPPLDPSDHARLLIRFDQVAIPHHPSFGLTAHLTEVENAREKVLPDGTIQGVLEKDAAEGRVDGIFAKLGSPGNEMDKLSGKTLGKIDTSVTYPPGTDLELALDQPLTVDSPSPPTAATEISPALAAAVQNMLAGAPQRVQSKTKKPGDPLNLIVVGSADQILTAFKQAGWEEARKLGTVTAVGTMRAMVSDNSYEQAPVSQLYLFGRAEDLAFEKILNTFLKRHHLRLWRTLVRPPTAAKSGWVRQPMTSASIGTGPSSHTRLIPTWMRNAPRWAPTWRRAGWWPPNAWSRVPIPSPKGKPPRGAHGPPMANCWSLN